MKGNCETCKHAETCKKAIGFMFGYCSTDYEPKELKKDENVEKEAAR